MLSMLLLLHVMAKCWLCLDEPPMIFALTCIEKFWNDAFCVVSYEASTWRGMRSTGWKQQNFPARLGGILNHPIISNILMMLDYCSKYIFLAFKCSYEFHGNGKKKQVEICIIYIYVCVCMFQGHKLRRAYCRGALIPFFPRNCFVGVGLIPRLWRPCNSMKHMWSLTPRCWRVLVVWSVGASAGKPSNPHFFHKQF